VNLLRNLFKEFFIHSDKMHLLKQNFNGNPNIGLYGIATEAYCLIGPGLSTEVLGIIKTVLNVPVIETSMCGTSLTGVFCAANSHKLIVPDIVFEEELTTLKKNKIDYEIISTKHTALGNNVLCNDAGCLVSREFSEADAKKIGEALGVKTVRGSINELDVVGSAAIVNKAHCLVHEDVAEKEQALIEELLKVKCGTGTINMGNPFIKSGMIVNNKGFVIGKSSGGPEIANADEVLGFLS